VKNNTKLRNYEKKISDLLFVFSPFRAFVINEASGIKKYLSQRRKVHKAKYNFFLYLCVFARKYLYPLIFGGKKKLSALERLMKSTLDFIREHF